MIHLIEVDDTTPLGKRIVEDARCKNDGVRFKNNATTQLLSDEYMSSDEFWKAVDTKLETFCQTNGIV